MTTLQQILSAYGIRTSTDLHKATGMSRQQASEIWMGRRNIGRKVALRIGEALGCPPILVMFREEGGESMAVATKTSKAAPKKPSKPVGKPVKKKK